MESDKKKSESDKKKSESNKIKTEGKDEEKEPLKLKSALASFSEDKENQESQSQSKKKLTFSEEPIENIPIPGDALIFDPFTTLTADKEGEYERKVKISAGRALELLQGVNVLHKPSFASITEELPDPMTLMQNSHLMLLQNKVNIWEDEENPTAERLAEKEHIRLEKVARDRGHLTCVFACLYHITVLFNFFFSWYESFRITMEEAKLQAMHLKEVYNCMDVISKAEWIDHGVNIFHALMSTCVLFAESSMNAGLCMAYVFSQAIHTAFETFQYFMHIRFASGHEITNASVALFLSICFNVVTSIVVVQRFYDLTDRVRNRAKYFAANVKEGKSMNDEIIYQNQSSFLQRKYILREAISSQVYKVIQKIGNYRDKGLKVDHVAMYRELHAAKAALIDVDRVENSKMLKELKKANAKRLRDLEGNPELQRTESIINGSMSKLFLVRFGDR